MSLAHDMGEAHEVYVASLLGGRKTRGSGNQWRDQGDGHQDRFTHTVSFGWDCKSTLGKSLSVSLMGWGKITEQAGMDRPAIPLRFYHDPRLHTFTDMIVVNLHDLAELSEQANRARRYDEVIERANQGEAPMDGYDGPQQALVQWIKREVGP